MEFGVTEFTVNATPIRANVDPGWRSIVDSGYKTYSGVEVSERSALGYAPFWRAINLIAGDVAGMPCDVFKRQRDGGKKYDSTHPAAPLLRDMAAPWWRSDDMRRVLTSHALIHGNGYGPIVRDMSGNPVEIGLVDPNQVWARIMEDGSKWYVIYIDGTPIKIPARDMIHIKGLGRDGITGYSIIELMKNALGVGMAAQEFGGRFFGSGSNMSGVLQIPGHFSEERIRNAISSWDTMQSGLKNSFKIALLQEGLKWQQTTIAPDQAQFLQTREFEVRATVANITGVPPHMLGDSTRTSHNSLESESQSYLHRCLNPWLKEWECELRTKLLTPKQRLKETHVIEFNREAEIQMEFEKKINGIYRQIECGVLTRNEGRNLLNMPKITDEDEGGDDYYHPANWVVAGEEPDLTTPAPAGSPPGTPGQDASEADAADPEEADTGSETTNVLRSLITATVTDNLKIERDRVVQRAGMQSGNFIDSVDEFYTQWTRTSGRGLTSSSARAAFMAHAEESKRQLLDVAGASTTDSLKANVQEVTALWDGRIELLVAKLMKEAIK